MFTDSIKTFGIFLVFTTVIQCFSYTLDLSEHHPRSNLHSRNSVESEFSRRNQISETETPNSLNSSPSSTWVGWNWKTQAPPPSFPTRKSVGRSSDWTWKEDSESKLMEEKTLKLQVLEDDSRGDIQRPQWPHEDSLYDPYAFQHQKRLGGHAQTHLHVHNSLDPYPFRPHHQAYEWQDLRPFIHRHHASPSYYAPTHLYNSYAHGQAQSPPSELVHGGLDFGSGASASSATGLASIAHASGHAHGFPIPGGWNAETNRKYGPQYNYHPPDYNRKRYRLEVHPGFIAAPIAGLAAFGVAHAFTSKPVLFELGLVDKKKGFSGQHPNHHHHHHVHPVPAIPPCISKPECFQIHSNHHPPGPHAQTLHPPYHPHQYPNHHHHPEISSLAHPEPHPPHSTEHPHGDHPSLRPVEKPHHESEQASRPWWSPFAAMIPRLRKDDFERD